VAENVLQKSMQSIKNSFVFNIFFTLKKFFSLFEVIKTRNSVTQCEIPVASTYVLVAHSHGGEQSGAVPPIFVPPKYSCAQIILFYKCNKNKNLALLKCILSPKPGYGPGHKTLTFVIVCSKLLRHGYFHVAYHMVQNIQLLRAF